MPDLEAIRAYYAKILPYYEREAAARGDLPFWRELAGRWRPARILEIGCGTGRVSSVLSETVPTVGIDISYDLLRRARPSRARLLAADLREPPFRGGFDLIVAPSDPLSHSTSLEDRRRALRAVARQLAPGGRFVLDALLRRGKKPIESERTLSDSRGDLRIREAWRPSARSGLWRATFTYTDLAQTGPSASTEASFLARAWDPAQVRTLFSSCGLAVERIWGGFSRRPFGPDSSRLIVVARGTSLARWPA